MLKAWSKAFPGSVRPPLSEISGELMSHIRYPRTCSRCSASCSPSTVTNHRRLLLGQRQVAWPVTPACPPRTSRSCSSRSRCRGGQGGVSITSPFVPASNTEAGREIHRGLLAVDADAGREAGSPPRPTAPSACSSSAVAARRTGPGAKPDPELPGALAEPRRAASAQYITNNSQSGARTFGNLLTFPLEGGMFYVQPIYVPAHGLGVVPPEQGQRRRLRHDGRMGRHAGAGREWPVRCRAGGRRRPQPPAEPASRRTPTGPAAAARPRRWRRSRRRTPRARRHSRPVTSRPTTRPRSGSTRRSAAPTRSPRC